MTDQNTSLSGPRARRPPVEFRRAHGVRVEGSEDGRERREGGAMGAQTISDGTFKEADTDSGGPWLAPRR